MKRAAISLPSILLAASVFLAPVANAAGMIFVDPITPGPRPVTLPTVTPVRPSGIITPTPRPTRPLLRGSVSFGLRLQGADVKVEVTDNVAKTYVSQTFANDTDANLAGTYLFPLPADTTFSSFSLHIDGRPVEGKILEANEARNEYERIVRQVVDPGLLEYADYKTVRARIFPIPAHGTKKVELEYTQLLKAENGMLKYRFPLKTEGAEEAEELKVAVKLNSKQGLRAIWSPSHKIDTKRDGDHKAVVVFDAKNEAPDKDFFLYYGISDKDVAANLVTNKSEGDDGYYLLTLSPQVENKVVAAKDIVLVVDTSGSMAGERMTQSKKALKYIISALSADDKFSIVQFNTDIESFKTQLVAASAANKEAATKFIDQLEAHGGTNIGDALKTGLTLLNSSQASTRPGYLVLATDGEPTVGETSVSGLLKSLDNKRDIRVFDFGVGYDVNTKLLDKLAEQHHGTAQYVEPSESFETSMSDFYNKIQKPVLTDVKVAYNGIDVKNIYPKDVKDIFAGSQVLLLGRYKGSGAATVKLTGTINGAQKDYSFPVTFASQELDNTYLPRMWAMRRIANLTDVAKDNGDTKEVVDEIIALSKKYGIISQYTSFLVTDPAETAALRNRVTGGWTNGVGAALPQVRMGANVRQPGDNLYRPSPQLARHSSRDLQIVNESPQVRDFRSMPSASRASGFVSDSFADEGSSFNRGIALNAMFKAAPSVGKSAVLEAKKRESMLNEVASATEKNSGVKLVDGKTFYLRGDVWVDSECDEKSAKPIEITFGTKEYFELAKTPGIGKFLSLGQQVLFVFNGKTYKIKMSEPV